MKRSGYVVSVFLLASVLASSSIAMAQFSSSTNANISAGAGTLNLVISSVSKGSGPSYATVTPSSLPSNTVTITVGPFAPGDTVTIDYTVTNAGSLPATSITSQSPSIVNSQDNNFAVTITGTVPTSLSPLGSFNQQVTITLASGLGNAAQGTTVTVTLGYTGTVGT